MISSIQVEGYRGFERFEMTNLGRLNLLVGRNNSGKTALLEALYLLTSRGDPAALWSVLGRRGERLPGRHGLGYPGQEFDVCHLFRGHEIHVGLEFTLSARNETPERYLTLSITRLSSEERKQLLGASAAAGVILPPPVLQIKGHPLPPVPILELSQAGGILGGVQTDALDSRRISRRASEEFSAQFITPESLETGDLLNLWDNIALTPDESLVLRALRCLDTNIERVAAQFAQRYFGPPSRAGFIVKLRGIEQPIPIGSMGDGMWRMLAIAIAITQCKGGVLLVDEIDTGLHYTVMSDMWRLISGAAKELDVQVFATTHSFDCIHSLASVCVSDHDPNKMVTLQRIEPGKPRAIPYSETEIRVAAEKNIEVR
ncbi:MAG TPA: ATP-binding protein [Blastocatellia bacterium]|nr:ATP-binding protein [Blastocatellia bacterium]